MLTSVMVHVELAKILAHNGHRRFICNGSTTDPYKIKPRTAVKITAGSINWIQRAALKSGVRHKKKGVEWSPVGVGRSWGLY